MRMRREEDNIVLWLFLCDSLCQRPERADEVASKAMFHRAVLRNDIFYQTYYDWGQEWTF